MFHLHARRVLAPSTNGFAHKWPPQFRPVNSTNVPIVLVAEPSPLLNLVFHCVYDLPCTHFSSSAEDVSACVATIVKYGLPLSAYASQDGSLYNLVLSRAPTAGIQMYALAAQHNLEQLATAVSRFLLSFDLATLTDDLAGRMGAVYLKRLAFLHLGRSAALKRLLSPPLSYHTPDDSCGAREHDMLMNAWGLAITPLAWDARPGTRPRSTHGAGSNSTDRYGSDRHQSLPRAVGRHRPLLQMQRGHPTNSQVLGRRLGRNKSRSLNLPALAAS